MLETIPIVEGKLCRGCRKVKAFAEYYVHPHRGRMERHSRCKKCDLARTNEWRNKNIERVRAQARKHQGEIYQRKKQRAIESGEAGYADYLYQRAVRTKRHRTKLRNQVLDILGRKCARCGYNEDERALQIDHINGGGSRERKQMGNTEVMVKIIKAGGAGYQTLCANCNWIKESENGEDRKWRQ